MFKKLFFILLLFIFIAALIFIDARFIEPNLLITKNETLYLPNWDKDFDNLKIAVISDLHIGTKTVNLNKVKNISKKVNRKNPDLILFLGDFDSKTIQDAKYLNKELSEVFKLFKAKYGTFAVLGNHDYHTPGEENIKTFLQNADIKVLENKTSKVLINNKTLTVAGFKDLWYFPDINPEKIIGMINSPTIVMMHNPDTFPDIQNTVSLSLSGHTHGGEFVFPLFGSPIVPSKYGQRYRKGHIIENGKHLYVSGGVTTLSGYRFLNPPEISILTLRTQNDKTKILNTKPKRGFGEKHWKTCIKLFIYVKNFFQ